MSTRSLRLPLIVVSLTLIGAASAPLAAPGAGVDTGPEDGCTLRIYVDGLRNSRGVVGSVVFKSPDGWPEDIKKAFRTGPTPIHPGQRQATVVWRGLPPGVYGVAAIHDENSNARLDKNLFGVPKEGFGFANNPHVGFSAPSFGQALVNVHCPATDTTIHLQYK